MEAKALTLYETTIGKKALLALSGTVLFGFVVVHMLGGTLVYTNAAGAFTDSGQVVGPAGTALTIGAGDLALKLGGFTLGGIGTATFGAILLYQFFRDGED